MSAAYFLVFYVHIVMKERKRVPAISRQ